MYDLGSGGSGISFFGQEHLIKFGKLDAKSPDLVGWGLQKDSGKTRFSCSSTPDKILSTEFSGMFNHHLSKMRRAGILDKLELKWLSPSRGTCLYDVRTKFEGTGL